MNSALIVMTILGCNDSATDCRYITTVEQRWPTVALCDSVSEERLPSFANQPYPVIIAVCQNPDEAIETAAKTKPLPQQDQASAEVPVAPEPGSAVSEEQKQSLASRAIQRVRNVLPTTEGVKTLVTTPVRLVEGGYSWVAKRFDR
jgi:hypothetical protein